MTDCVIADNSVDGIGDVGALSMRDGKLVHCTITGNRSDEAWGGMSCEGDVEMWYCAITENVSSVGGGALRCKAGNVKLYNCIIAGNLGGYEYSTGGLLADEADLLIQNCTIADNPSRRWDSTVAGGLVFKSAQVRIANSVIWGNADEEQVLQIEAQNSTLTVAYSDVEGGRDAIAAEAGELIWSDGNIDADPLFVDSEDGDYHIQIGSPCVDAGNPDYTPHTDETQPDGLETDIDGQPRVWAGRIDMGADELFDCNGNGVDDDEDLAAGVLTDGDGDGVPDECAPSGTEDPNDATDPDDPNDALDDGMQPLPPIACGPGACGVGVVGWLPLTALGLAALRRTAGRPAARR